MTEKWKPISGYEGTHEVSNMGRVRSLERVIIRSDGRQVKWKGRVLKASSAGRGYRAAVINLSGRKRSHYIHALVAEAFIGKRPKGWEINHIDGDKTNNCAGNLEYVTRQRNMDHARDNGLMAHGSNQWMSKLTEMDVADMRRDYSAGKLTQRQLADKYGIAHQTVYNVVTGETWRHVDAPPVTSKPYFPRGYSRFKGVTFNKNTGKWQAQIGRNGSTRYLGSFAKEEDAALAYRKAEKEISEMR